MRLRTHKTTITVKVGDVTVHGCKLTPSDIDRLRDRYTTWTGRNKDVPEVDSIGLAKAIFRETITGWENAQDANGKDMECTDANKDLVYEHDQQFAGDVVAAINKAAEAREDLLEKN